MSNIHETIRIAKTQAACGLCEESVLSDPELGALRLKALCDQGDAGGGAETLWP